MTDYSMLEQIKLLSPNTGVYQFHDALGNLLYVGKAKNLKNRISSYFYGKPANGKIKVLLSKTTEIRYLIVPSEWDALILEDSLG